MAYAQSIRLAPETVRSLGFASITTSYMGVGSAMSNPIRMFLLQNLTDAELMFSFDGVNDHVPLPANGFLLLDISANKTASQGYYLAEGTRIYVKESGNPTSGTVYLTTFYGAE